MDPASQSACFLWVRGGISCALKAGPLGYDVELRNATGIPFLRKTAATMDAAANEAEYLRLLLDAETIPPPAGPLKPFALVVEDDPDSCDAFTEALRNIGVRALGVSNGEEAMRLARALLPDLLVVDYGLPDISGAEVCRQLRDDPETEPLPMIAVTGMPDALRDDGCVADAVLIKPCRVDTFIAAARLFLRPAAINV